jgi:hypothetical protein
MARHRPHGDDALISVRAALILGLATLAAMTAGVLSYLDDQSMPAALLVAGGAWLATTGLFTRLIER